MIKWEQGQELLGEYLIEKEIGQSGGMGRVWLVKSNSTGRRFAVKQAKLKDEKSRKAFLTELQTWIDLPEHPNVVPCRFFRTVGDEIVIFTDYAEGGSLAEWIAKGKLTTWEQILDVAIQFAWGLHAIHERGLVHQDVKPGNVLMTADGVPMVADFGLARTRQYVRSDDDGIETEATGQHSLLVLGAGAMTKEYASPEQRAGKQLSRKTDIWSWGVSVLDMFMGGVSCPEGGQIAEVRLEGFMEYGGKEENLPRMPEGVVDILRKCFAIDLARRWNTMEEISAIAIDIYNSSSGRIYGKGMPAISDISSQSFRHERVGTGGVQWGSPLEWLRKAYTCIGRDPAEADSYQVLIARSRKGAALADMAIINEAEQAFRTAISSGDDAAIYMLSNLLLHKSLVSQSVGDTPGAITALEASVELLKQPMQQGDYLANDAMATTLGNMALLRYSAGDMVRARQNYDESIEIIRGMQYRNTVADVAINLAQTLCNKSSLLVDINEIDSAHDVLAECLEISNKMGGKFPLLLLADVYAQQTVVYHKIGDYGEALTTSCKCIDIFKKMVDCEHRNELREKLASALMNRGHNHEERKDYHAAIRDYDESILILSTMTFNEGRTDLLQEYIRGLMNKSICLHLMNDSTQALNELNTAINTCRQAVNENGRSDLEEMLAMLLMAMATTLGYGRWASPYAESLNESVEIYDYLVNKRGRHDLLDTLNVCIAYRHKMLRRFD